MAFGYKKSLIKVQGGRTYLPVSARLVTVRIVPIRGYGRTRYALVDAGDYPLVSMLKWHCNGNYARACMGTRGNYIYMHRLIMAMDNEQFTIDHRDGNTLNNRRGNLRICTQSVNCCNKRQRKDATSRFKGIRWSPRRNHWTAEIRVQGRCSYLGAFYDDEAAARAYDHAARERFGEFATVNFPLPGERSAV